MPFAMVDENGEEEEHFLWAGGGPLPLGSPGSFSAGGGSQAEPAGSPVEDLVDSDDSEGLTGADARRARQLRREKSEALRLQRLKEAAAMRRERSRDSLDAMIVDVQEARAKRLAAKLAARRWSSQAGENMVDDDEAAKGPDEEIACTKATFVENKQDRARRLRVAQKAAARRSASGDLNVASGNEGAEAEAEAADGDDDDDDDDEAAAAESDALEKSIALSRAKSTKSTAPSDAAPEQKETTEGGSQEDKAKKDKKEKKDKKDKKEKKEKKKEKEREAEAAQKLEKEQSRKRDRSFSPPSPRAMAIAKAMASGATYLARQLEMGGALPQAGPSITWDPRINAPVADGQAALPPSQQMAALPAPMHNSPYAKEVEEFCNLGGADEASTARMKRLPPHLQRAVMDKGTLQGMANPTAALVSRMRDAELGRILPSAAVPALAAPPPQLALTGDPMLRDPTLAMVQRF